jgi:signal transduction histidine kinase
MEDGCLMKPIKPCILAIDDTPANLMTLGAALAEDYDLQFATSGQQGLMLAAQVPPDLILLDIMMPEMDGYEVCRRLKADPSLQNIPVIFVTALAEMDAESAGLELGAADYLTKPINVGIARQRIRNLLEREQLRKAVEAERNLLEQRVAERTAELEAVAGAREKALAAAEYLSALKTQFINNMSHELRTPLNHVIGLSALSQRAKDLEKAKDYAQKIQASGEHLLELVTSVLDYSDVEAGQMKVSHEAFDLSGLLIRLAEKYAEKAQAKGLVFEMQQSEAIAQTMTGDPKRLQQVLEELLGNAVKFTEQGRVTFAVRSGADQIEFAVTDSGVGMTTEQLEAGFKPFQQADGSSTRRFGGLGLGLALTEHLVKLMGGELAVESRMSEGTTFRLTLPLPRTDCSFVPLRLAGL